MKEEMRQKFIEILGNNRVLFDEPMSQHTTFRIGGPADVFAMPENYEQIREVLRLCREEKLPFFCSGKRQQSSCQRQRIQRRDHSDGPKHGRNPCGR